jgi:hypothetical protein
VSSRKLTRKQLVKMLGEERAEKLIEQDRRCAEVYGDIEQRTKLLKEGNQEAEDSAGGEQ